MHMTIAMDGPVGAGKSSVADDVAKALGILHLDTGAISGYSHISNGVDRNIVPFTPVMEENRRSRNRNRA